MSDSNLSININVEEKLGQMNLHEGDMDKNHKGVKRKNKDEPESSAAKQPRTDVNQKITQNVASYKKRPGTSGFSGQLYETKLIALILFRVSTNDEIDHFFLGTNIDEIGAFDDVVIKIFSKGQKKSKIIFVQSKHKDNPEKNKVTLVEVKKKSGDFSLEKYFISFLHIVQIFSPANDSVIFNENFEDVDCEFVIYTPGENDISENEADIFDTTKDDMLHSKVGGKILKLKAKYADSLTSALYDWRVKQLGESLANFVLSDDENSDIMSDFFMKTFHVFLARNVIEVDKEIIEDISETNVAKSYRKAKISKTFLDSKDNLMSGLRDAIYKKVVAHREKSLLQPDEIDSIIVQLSLPKDTVTKLSKNIKKELHITQFRNELNKVQVKQDIVNKAITIATRHKIEPLLFKVSTNFGNLNFEVTDESGLDKISAKTAILLNTDLTCGSNIKIEDANIGSQKIINNEDISLIGGLVGNLLVLDEEAKMLKFDTDPKTVSAKAKYVYEKIKVKLSRGHLNDYRFQFNVKLFPRLSLSLDEYDKELINEFLTKLKIYTNQAKESDVEIIVKNEIAKLYHGNRKRRKRYRIKGDAMYLKVHDKIQRWWKLQENAPYLTETCNLFDQAKNDVSPLLTILNFKYTEHFKDNIKFDENAIKILELDHFIITPSERILNIVTNHHFLTGIKLFQYFEAEIPDKYTFIDLDYVMKEGYYDDICDELKDSLIEVLVIKCEDCESLQEFLGDINTRKIIVISDTAAENEHMYQEKKDERNNLTDLNIESQRKLLEEAVITYQGEDMKLGELIDDSSMHLLNAEVLSMILKNENVKIGKALTDTQYESVKGYYIDRKLNRYIKLKDEYKKSDGNLNEDKLKDFCVMYDNIDENNTQKTQDLIVISDNDEDFKNLCSKYKDSHHNIHWVKKKHDEFVWEKSRGSLMNLVKCFEEGERSTESDKSEWDDEEINVEGDVEESSTKDEKLEFTLIEPKTIRDIEDNVVIVAAEPGMGKTTLLTYLSIQNKKCDLSSWIIRINLVDFSSDFTKWQEGEIQFDHIVKFLFKVIDFQAFNENKDQTKKTKKKVVRNILDLVTVGEDNEIILKYNTHNMLKGLALFEMEIFRYLFNRGKIVVLLDGFDEISSDYKNEVTTLLNFLRCPKIERLWITTRSYNIQSELELILNTFAYTLEPFSLDDQKNFLENFWKTNLEIEEINQKSIDIFFEEVMERFSENFENESTVFTGIPMHLYMIGKIFQNTFKEFHNSGEQIIRREFVSKLRQNLDLNSLYERFVNTKIREIFFEEKKLIWNKDDPSIKRIIEDVRVASIDKHKKLALSALFDGDIVNKLLTDFEKKEFDKLVEMVETGVEAMGFVDKIVNNKPRFVHLSFAEYFATDIIAEKLKTNFNPDFMWDFLINTVLIERFENVRRFFSSKLANDNELDSLNTKEDNKKRIFDLLLKQGNDVTVQDTAIGVAMAEYLINIVAFLLQTFNENVNQDNLDDFIKLIKKGDFLPSAIQFGCQNLLVDILNRVKKLDSAKSIDIINYDEGDGSSQHTPLTAAFISGNMDMVDVLLKDLSNKNLVRLINIQFSNSNKETVLHQLARNCEFSFLECYLEKLNGEELMQVAMVTDDSGNTPAHNAGSNLDIFYFEFFRQGLTKEDFKTVCLTPDGKGKTALDYLNLSVELMTPGLIARYSALRDYVYSDN